MKIKFIDVGRDKKCWEAEIPCVDESISIAAILKSIRKNKAIMSRDVEITDDGGIFVGGLRKVGEWRPAEGQ